MPRAPGSTSLCALALGSSALLALAGSPAASARLDTRPLVLQATPNPVLPGAKMLVRGRNLSAPGRPTVVTFKRGGGRAVDVRATRATPTRLFVVVPRTLANELEHVRGRPVATRFRLGVRTATSSAQLTRGTTSLLVLPHPATGASGSAPASLSSVADASPEPIDALQAVPTTVPVPATTLEPLSAAGPAAPSPPPVAPQTDPAPSIHVAPSGNDTGSGTAGSPVKTLQQALLRATGGQVIRVAPGTYDGARDAMARTERVRVVSEVPGQAHLGAIQIFGGQRIRFEGFAFDGGVAIEDHVIRKQAQPPVEIDIRDSSITAVHTGINCVVIRSGARAINVVGNRLRDCFMGISGPGGAVASRDITIAHNDIRDMKADGIQFGGWSDVVIRDNVIDHIRDPDKFVHTDGIQLTGNITNALLLRNRIFDTGGQLLFMQEGLGQIDGVVVRDNLLAHTDGYAVQSQGVTRATFVGNTIWDARFGAILLRPGLPKADGTADVPKDTVVVKNLLSRLTFYQGAGAAESRGNVVLCGAAAAPGTRCVADPGFVDHAARDYRVRTGSPVRNQAAITAETAPEDRSGTDLAGSLRVNATPGAFD